MKFENVSDIMLFGGGKLLASFALFLKNHKFSVIVVTSKRHVKEYIDINKQTNNLLSFLKSNKIKVKITLDPNKDNAIKKTITNKTLGISLGAAWIFQIEFINLFKGKLINLHGTQLPRNRGGGGHSWQIMQKNRLGYAVIHQIDNQVDTGKIIEYREFIYPNSCRIPQDYEEEYIEQCEKLLVEFWNKVIKQKEFTTTDQQNYFSSYWPRLATHIHGFIDWNWSLNQLESFICAFDSPYQGASTFINGKQIYIKECLTDTSDGLFHPFQTGIVYKKQNNTLYVATVEGSLIILKVIDKLNNDIKNRIIVGDRFYTPNKYLDKAKQIRAFYTPLGLQIKHYGQKISD